MFGKKNEPTENPIPQQRPTPPPQQRPFTEPADATTPVARGPEYDDYDRGEPLDPMTRERNGAQIRTDGQGPTSYAGPDARPDERGFADRPADPSYGQPGELYDGQPRDPYDGQPRDPYTDGPGAGYQDPPLEDSQPTVQTNAHGTVTDTTPSGLVTDPETGRRTDLGHDDTRQLPVDGERHDYADTHRTAAYDDDPYGPGEYPREHDGIGPGAAAAGAGVAGAGVGTAVAADHDETGLSADEKAKGGYRINKLGGWLLGILRILLGFQFLWAFIDKTFGLGYNTPSDSAWVNGGSPTEGFLSGVTGDDSNNPFKPMFQFFLDQSWTDWVFMIGLAGIGIALILGIAMWFTAICATVLLVLMYLAAWPIEANPFVDSHLLSAVTVLALAACNSGAYIGLGRAWKTRRAHR